MEINNGGSGGIGGVTSLNSLTGAVTLVAGANVSLTPVGNAITIAASSGSGIVVGTTAISAGTTTRILYDNAGVVGEYTISGSGTSVAMSTAPTFATSITGSYLTASQILITDGSKNIISADIATYPSLTELTYLKGVTSAIQTQLNGKAATLSGTINQIAYFDSASTIASLTTVTYPSLTELSYVKGVTSAVQTQLDNKQGLDTQLTSLAALSYTGNAGKFIRVNAGETDFELATVSGGGDALTSNPLSQFASTTSSQLAGVISDETGSGSLVFATSPTLVTPTTNALTISGNQSVASWTTNGVRIKGVAGTLTDTTSTGTVATAYTNVLGGNTIAASNSTTFTNYVTAYFREPIAGTNVTFTNKWGLGADSLRIGTSNQLTVSTTGVLNATSPVFVTPSLGVASATSLTTTGAIELGNASDTTLARVSAGVVSIEGVNIETTATMANTKKTTIGFSLPDSASCITGKVAGFFTCPYAGTISAWSFVVDAGTATVKVWKIATGTAKPTSSNSINTSGVAISTGTAVRSTTTSDFTSTTVTANDIFAFNVEAISGVSQLTFNLEITKS